MNLDGNSLKSEPELTREIVQNRIDYGEYVVAYDSKSKSLVYKFMMKVFAVKGGSAVPHWFYCPFCHGLLQQNVTIGTTPLLRHVEKMCPDVPEATRQELSLLRIQKSMASTKRKSEPTNEQNASLSQQSHTQTTATNATPNLNAIASFSSHPNPLAQALADSQFALPSQPLHTETTLTNVAPIDSCSSFSDVSNEQKSSDNISPTRNQIALPSQPSHTQTTVANATPNLSTIASSSSHPYQINAQSSIDIQIASLLEPPHTQSSAVYIPLTLGQMADALVQANRIGTVFGETIDSATYERLLMGIQPW